MTRWSFASSPLLIALAVAVWLAAAVLSFLQWRWRGGGKLTLALESLRLLVIAAICVALLKPEIVREIRQTDPPQVAVLFDGSRSMTTRDLPLGEGKVLTRGEWIEQKRAAKFWSPLEAKGRVTVEDFSKPAAENEAASKGEEGTDIDEALEKVATRGGNLKAVLLLTDGDWNIGKPPAGAATMLRARNVPVYTVAIGSEKPLPDLELEHTTTPSYGLLGEQISIPFKIQSHLPRDVTTTLRLDSPRGGGATKSVTIPAFAQVQDSIVWQPTEAGDFTLTLKLPVEKDEALADNNEQTFRISVRSETLKVLVVDSEPRWEYRFLRNALARDPGVSVECLLLHPGMKPGEGRDYIQAFPATKEAISKFDVVFLGDVGVGNGELKNEDVELIRGLVEQQGSGLVFLPGARGRELTLRGGPLGDLLPVEFDDTKPQGDGQPNESHLLLTSEGKGHLLTMLAGDETTNAAIWKNLPGFYWSAAVKKNRPGSEVLAVHSSLRNAWGRVPLLVTRPHGNGKVLFMGTDGAWRWRRGVEDKYHYRFWGQVVRWMAHQRHLAAGERVRLSFSPENPRTGDTVMLLATVLDASGFPIEKGNVSAKIRTPNGGSERVEFTPVPGGWGVFRGEFVPRAGGKFKLDLANESGGQTLATELFVAQPTREKTGQPANFGALREIADITRGASGAAADLDAIVKQIALLPEPKPVEKRLRLWSEWWAGAAVLGLLAIYWAGRKLAGMI